MASMLDVAFDYISDKGTSIAFDELWNHVCEIKNFSEDVANDKLPKFYSSLMVDGRFVTLGENIWDLRERHTYDKVHISMNDVYPDAEEDSLNEDYDDSDDDYIEEEKESKKKKSSRTEESEYDDEENEEESEESEEEDEEDKEEE